LKQTKAHLVGGEFSLKSELATWCVTNIGIDFVRAENKATNNPLPFIPPSKIVLGIRLQKENLGNLSRAYIGFKTKIVSNQERIDPLEIRTGGYTLYDFSSGFEVVSQENIITVDVGIENIFNKAYVNHLSRYKLYALNSGRNFTLKISIPFQII
jgi:iron complex outermembrane receptor protein